MTPKKTFHDCAITMRAQKLTKTWRPEMVKSEIFTDGYGSSWVHARVPPNQSKSYQFRRSIVRVAPSLNGQMLAVFVFFWAGNLAFYV